METRKKNKHVEVQFIADQDVGKEIISIKDMKNKKIGINIDKYVSNAYTLTLIAWNCPLLDMAVR
jgi:hypothetical protein